MSFFDAPWHIVLLVLVALLLFGSSRLPGAAKALGQSMNIFKKSVKGMDDDASGSTSVSPGAFLPPASPPAQQLPQPTASAQQVPQAAQSAPPAHQAQLDELQRQVSELQRQAAGGNGGNAGTPADPQPDKQH